MPTFIELKVSDLVAAVDELLDAARSQRDINAIDTAYEMLLGDALRNGNTCSVAVDELDGEYRVKSRTVEEGYYLVTVDECGCFAAVSHRPCWHRKYVQILERFRQPVKRRKITYEKAAIEREIAELWN